MGKPFLRATKTHFSELQQPPKAHTGLGGTIETGDLAPQRPKARMGLGRAIEARGVRPPSPRRPAWGWVGPSRQGVSGASAPEGPLGLGGAIEARGIRFPSPRRTRPFPLEGPPSPGETPLTSLGVLS